MRYASSYHSEVYAGECMCVRVCGNSINQDIKSSLLIGKKGNESTAKCISL